MMMGMNLCVEAAYTLGGLDDLEESDLGEGPERSVDRVEGNIGVSIDNSMIDFIRRRMGGKIAKDRENRYSLGGDFESPLPEYLRELSIDPVGISYLH